MADEGSPPPASTDWTRRARGPIGWAALLICIIIAGICWAVSSPVGSSPDDDFHLASIYCPSEGTAGCAPKSEQVKLQNGKIVPMMSVLVPNMASTKALCYVRNQHKNGDCSKPNPNPDELYRSIRFNTGSYPGMYFHVAHLLSSKDTTATTIRVRIMNVILFAVLITTLGLLAPPATRRLMAFLVPVTSVPLGVFVVASINPSSWTFTGVLAGWLALHIVLQSDHRRTQILAGVVGVVGTVMAMGSRADGGPYLAIAAVALTLLHYRSILAARWKILPPLALAIAGGLGLLLGGQASIATDGTADAIKATGRGGGLFHNLIEWPQLIDGMFGSYFRGALGWLDTFPPAMTYVGIEIAVGGLILIGLRSLAWHKAVAALLVFGAMVALPIRVLQTHAALIGTFVQPRYILPLLPLLLGVLLIGKDPRRTARFTRAQVAFLYVVVVLANLGALYANLRRYVTGSQVVTFNLNNPIGWWWHSGPSPMTIWVLGTLAFAVAAAPMLVTGWRRTPRAAPPTDRSVDDQPADDQTADDQPADDQTPTEQLPAVPRAETT